MTIERTTSSAAATRAFARSFAASLVRGDMVALFGELGSGKTQFVKGVCEAFSPTTAVISPTFILLNRYEGKDVAGQELFLYHFDLYRVQSPLEIFDLGYEEFMYGNGICFIEWAERLGDLLPRRHYNVQCFFGEQEEQRIFRIRLQEN